MFCKKQRDKYVLPSTNTMKCHQLTQQDAGLYHENRLGICMHDTIETAIFICGTLYQKISGTSGKNHFHEMNGDVGMAGWK